FMLLYSPRWLFLYPGAAVMLLGSIVGAWLLLGPHRVGPAVLDVQTLLYVAVAILLGFQAVMFAVFTKIYAISQGLLPEDPRLNRWYRIAKLESGVIVGLILLGLGSAGTLTAFQHWRHVSFGNLNASSTLRVVIPSVLFVMLGAQVILSSFFLSVLGLHVRRPR